MMKKRQLAILIAIAAVLAASSIILCVFLLTRENIARAENQYEEDYSSYSIHKCDDFMNIDGVLDEEQWQDMEWLHNTGFGMDDPVSYDVTAFPTSKGAYVAFKVEDSNIVYNGEKNMSNNTNFYLRVAGYQDETMFGSLNHYRKGSRINVGCYASPFTDFDRAIVVDGEVNSGKTKGAVLETFFSWESLGIDTSKGIPTQVGVLPIYLAMLPGQESLTLIDSTGVESTYNSGYAFMFDESGYLGTDKDGAVVGCAVNGHTRTPGWDLSKEQEGIVEAYTPSDKEFLYFKNMYAKNMIVETTLIPTSNCLEHAKTTRAGIAFVNSGGVYGSVCAVMREDKECSYDTGVFSEVCLFTSVPSSETINTIHDETRYKNTNTQPGVKLTVIKYGDTYISFMDGNFMGVQVMQSCAGEVYPALYSCATGAIFKDYSCKEITEADMLKYLNDHNVYQVKTQLASGGGRVEASQNYVAKGSSVDVSIVTNKGYVLESVKINDKEKMSSLKKSAEDGTFTLDDISRNYDVNVKFAKHTGTNSKLTVLATSETNLSAELIVTLKSNGLIVYKNNIRTNENMTIEFPPGTYHVKIKAEGYVIYKTQVNLNKDKTMKAALQASAFPEKVTVNGKTLPSNRKMYDFTKEADGKVSTSYASGSKLRPLYFNKTAKDFVVTATINYTTDFIDGIDYQKDLMGGFYLHDGTNFAWIAAWRNGLAYRGLQKSSSRLKDLASIDYLLYPEPVSVEFTMVKSGAKVYLYFNDALIKEMNYTELGPDLDPNKEVAIGLTMLADKTADIQFSNYSLQTGEAAVKKFFEAHKVGSVKSKKLSANPLFAEYNMLGVKNYQSALNSFNVFADKVTGSYAMGSPKKNLWLYSEQGSTTALVSAKIRYSSDFKEGIDYQPDLFAGFSLASESNYGWIMAVQRGTHVTGSMRDESLVKDYVLLWNGTDTPKDVTLTLAVQDRYIYVYFDGVLVKRYMKSAIVEGADQNTKLIFGLRMNSDKEADFEYSEITYTEDAKKVSEYISTHK